MIYYNIYDLNNNLMGVISALGLRYYNPFTKRMLCCDSHKKAQYVFLNNQYYRPDRLVAEHPDMIGTFPNVKISFSTEDDFKSFYSKEK